MSLENEDRIRGEILQALRINSKGMTVTEISRYIGLNRNSTAKYLDILRVNGQIDLRPMGRAKLYYISQRVPISALLDFSTDYILVLDNNMSIIEVNDNFQKFFKVKKDLLLDVNIRSSNLPIFTTQESLKKIRKALKGKDSTFEAELKIEEGKQYFRGKLIPSTLGDGTRGVTVIMENVTDQKEAEKKLIESELRYRELIENQGEGLCLTDQNDVFIFANPSAERIMGVGSGELTGRSISEFLSRDETRKLNLHNERRRRGKKDTYQLDIHSADGKIKVILVTATPRYGEQGNFIGSFGVFRDISLMKENEKRTEASEERYRSLFEGSSDAIVILRNRSIIQCNLTTVKMFGYETKEEIIGLDPSVISPEYQDNGKTSESEVMRRLNDARVKGFVNMQWNHMRKDGSLFLADVRINRIVIGEETLFQAVIRDVTELETAKQEIMRNESKLNNILSSLYASFIGLIKKDHTYEEFWGSDEMDQRYGIRSHDIKDTSIFDFAPREARDDFKAIVDSVFRSGQPVQVEVPGRTPKGKFWQAMAFSPFLGENGKVEYVVQFATDTTEKKEAMQALKEVERKYRLLDDYAMDVIWISDNNLNYTYASSSTKNLTGYEPEELIGTSILDRIDPLSKKNILDRYGGMISEINQGKEVPLSNIKLEVELIKKDGNNVWTEMNISIIKNEKEQPSWIIGVTRDISDRKVVERKLKMKDHIFKSIYDMGSGSLDSINWKEKIAGSIERIGEAMGVSRSYIFKNRNDVKGKILTTQIVEWTNKSITKQAENPDLLDFNMKDGFQRWIEALSRGDTIDGDIINFPAIEKELLENQAIISIAVVPIMVKNKWWGFIGFDECEKSRNWSKEELQALKMAGSMLGNLIAAYGLE